MSEKKTDEELTFEKALARLETVVREMEGGQLSLDRMMAAFEEGSRLVQFCSVKLNEVEKKIEILVKKGEQVGTAPFSPGESPAGAG